MDCRNIAFVPQKSTERFNKALRVFDPKVLFRILAFALHIFGAKRNIIAELVDMPEESVKTTIRVVSRDGYPAFLDRRKSETISTPKPFSHKNNIHIRMDGDCVVVDLNSNNGKLKIPASNKIQVRTVLLSLMNSGIVSTREVAAILDISDAHCRKLAENLANNDVADSLIDKRIGQLHDYRVGPMQKTEIIRQFAARSITGHSTASHLLADLVKNQTKSELSPRTVRWHVNKLGLSKIKKTLPELVEILKKKP